MALLLHLALSAPLVLIVFSGGKSLHGWFRALGRDEAKLHHWMKYAVSLGACHSTWSPAQLCRMPDGTRHPGGRRQEILYFNPRFYDENNNTNDNKVSGSGQEAVWEAQKHHTVVANLCHHGFSQERAQELWAGLDQKKSIEALIADALFWAAHDNTAEVYGNEAKTNNGELPPDVVADLHHAASFAAAPDFDVPPDATG